MRKLLENRVVGVLITYAKIYNPQYADDIILPTSMFYKLDQQMVKSEFAIDQDKNDDLYSDKDRDNNNRLCMNHIRKC